MQPQPYEVLHHYRAPDIKTLWRYKIKWSKLNLTLKSGGSSFCFNHCLNSLWHAVNQIIPSIVSKVIPNTDNHLLRNLLRHNMSIFLWNNMLHMSLNVRNRIEIRGIRGVLMVLHSKLFSNRNTPSYEEKHCPPSQSALPHLQMTPPRTLVAVLSGFDVNRW